APSAAPQVIDIPGKQPRSLAFDPSSGRVFVSIFESGNNTSIVAAAQVKAAGGLPKASPKMTKSLPKAPLTGLIVKWNGTSWTDERGNSKWDAFISPRGLADIDLVVLDASGATPAISSEVRGIGTHIGNAAYDAEAHRLYVANTDSLN